MASGSVPELFGAERFSDVDQEPTGPLTPIEGYEKKPLVPLEEAVKRIKEQVTDIDRMVWLAKRDLSLPADGLTSEESAAIRLYTMEWPKHHESIYIQLNRALRSEERDRLRPWFSYLKLILTALYKLPSIKGIVWRGICGDVSEDYKKDYIWWGFSSCTTRMEIMQQFTGSSDVSTIFMIECVHGKSISNYSQLKKENEILLMPGTFLRVVDKCKLTKGLHMIHLQETNPPHQLIAPPFNSSLCSNNQSGDQLLLAHPNQKISGITFLLSFQEHFISPHQ
jgi:hypothetical protein